MTLKKLFLFSFLFLLFSSFMSCTLPPDLSDQISKVLLGDQNQDGTYGDGTGEGNSCSRLRTCKSFSNYLSFENLYFVDSGNASKYVLEGECDEEEKPVEVRVNGCPHSTHSKV